MIGFQVGIYLGLRYRSPSDIIGGYLQVAFGFRVRFGFPKI